MQLVKCSLKTNDFGAGMKAIYRPLPEFLEGESALDSGFQVVLFNEMLCSVSVVTQTAFNTLTPSSNLCPVGNYFNIAIFFSLLTFSLNIKLISIIGPQILQFSPSNGPAIGGTTITITGMLLTLYLLPFSISFIITSNIH